MLLYTIKKPCAETQNNKNKERKLGEKRLKFDQCEQHHVSKNFGLPVRSIGTRSTEASLQQLRQDKLEKVKTDTQSFSLVCSCLTVKSSDPDAF